MRSADYARACALVRGFQHAQDAQITGSTRQQIFYTQPTEIFSVASMCRVTDAVKRPPNLSVLVFLLDLAVPVIKPIHHQRWSRGHLGFVYDALARVRLVNGQVKCTRKMVQEEKI